MSIIDLAPVRAASTRTARPRSTPLSASISQLDSYRAKRAKRVACLLARTKASSKSGAAKALRNGVREICSRALARQVVLAKHPDASPAQVAKLVKAIRFSRPG
jgi:alpha-D-ribose 1-methylphosphonate 5-triphosphate diphosphatase PhnM